MAKEPEEVIAELKMELGELKAARRSDKTALETREHENRDYRNRIKELKSSVTELQAKIPADGSVILSSDDASLLSEYRELGDATSIQAKLGALDEARATAERMNRREALRGVAENENWVLSVLEDQLDGQELKVATDNGRTEVKIAQKGKADMEVREFIEQFKEPYLRALQATPTDPLAPIGAGNQPARADRTYTDEEIIAAKRSEVSF